MKTQFTFHYNTKLKSWIYLGPLEEEPRQFRGGCPYSESEPGLGSGPESGSGSDLGPVCSPWLWPHRPSWRTRTLSRDCSEVYLDGTSQELLFWREIFFLRRAPISNNTGEKWSQNAKGKKQKFCEATVVATRHRIIWILMISRIICEERNMYRRK